MADDKLNPNDAPPPPQQTSQKSTKGKEPLSSRIAASVSGLAKDFVSSSIAHESSSTLNGSLSGLSSKVQNGSSSSAPSTSAAWQEALPSKAGSTSTSSGNAGTSTPEAFRSTSAAGSADAEFSEFYTGPAMPTSQESESRLGYSSWTEQFGTTAPGPSQDSLLSAYQHGVYSSMDDGAEVRDLLNEPGSLSHAFDEMAFTAPSVPEVPSEKLFQEPFSDTELSIAERMRSMLPPPPQHTQTATDSPLNLFPDFNHSAPAPQQGNSDYLAPLRTFLGAWSDAQSQESNLDAWAEVRERYDELLAYGDPRPVLVLQKVVEKVLDKNDPAFSKSSASERLKMILGHLAEHNVSIEASSQPVDTGAANADEFGSKGAGQDDSNMSLVCPHNGCGQIFSDPAGWAHHFQFSHLL